MNTSLSTLFVASSFSLLLACGGGGDDSGDGSDGAGGAPSPSRDLLEELPVGEMTPLIQGDWSIDAGTEKYVCVRRTIGKDLFVDGFDALSPTGTHHTVLSVGARSGPDGVRECSDSFEQHAFVLHATGIGTGPVDFPEGVAVKLPEGLQLHLNIHLFNTSADELTGTSGSRGRGVAPADVVHEAEAVLMGTEDIRVPARESMTFRGVCTQIGDAHLFATFPHMHQIGTHMRVVAESSIMGDVTILDDPFQFDQQPFMTYPIIDLAQGDQVVVDCTYDNPTDQAVRFGESSNDEMCYAITYRYPALGTLFGTCTD